jgi:O-antigen/teichoic acid export membrane protein
MTDNTDATARPPGRVRPLRNASYQAIAGLVGKAISFLLVFYATRALGPALFGNYTTVLAFVGLFGLCTDLGMGTLAVRDVAQNPALAMRYVSNLLAVRVLSSLSAILLIVLATQTFVAPSLRSAVYVYALTLAPLAVWNTLQLVFQFSERLAYSAVLSVGVSTATTALSVVALALGHHVLALVMVYTGVNAVGTAVAAWLVYTRFLPPRLELDLAWWPELLRKAAPFAVLTLLNMVYSRADMQILYVLSGCGHMVGNAGCAPVGNYGAAYRFLDVLAAIFLGATSTATLPAFNRVAMESRLALARLVHSSVTLMLAFGVGVALLGTFFAPEALHVLAGRKYTVAAPALAILVWAFPWFLVLGMFYNALWALHKQTIVTVAFAITLVFNVALNIVLIPHFSYLASAALTVASEVLNGLIVFVALRRNLGPLGLAVPTAKVALLTAGTGAVLWALHPYGIVAGLPAGIIVLLVGLRLTRLFGPTEREILAAMPLVGRYTGLL